jgi:hypothetical protein
VLLHVHEKKGKRKKSSLLRRQLCQQGGLIEVRGSVLIDIVWLIHLPKTGCLSILLDYHTLGFVFLCWLCFLEICSRRGTA